MCPFIKLHLLSLLIHWYLLTCTLVYQIDAHIGIHLLFIRIKFIDRHHSAVVKFDLKCNIIKSNITCTFQITFCEFYKGATLNLKLFFHNYVLQYCMKMLKALYLLLL